MKRIVLTGGGTAGHVTPNLALIPRLLADGWDVHYIGEADGVEKRLIAAVPEVTYHSVSTGKLRRYFDVKNFTDPFKVVKGIGQASKLMKQLKPDVVFSKGGFVSVPVVYGARLHKVPVLLHESDMTPGLANKLCAPFARRILCTFPRIAKRLTMRHRLRSSKKRLSGIRSSSSGCMKTSRTGSSTSRNTLSSATATPRSSRKNRKPFSA